jgi:CheY-like chemotaxis protein
MGKLSGRAVLLVDDDPDNLELVELIFKGEGASVRAGSSALEALELLAGWKPDIMLLDIKMPGMDGYELLGRIRRDPALQSVPALAVTGGAFERDRQRAAAAGFAVHVTKPFDTEALLHLVESLVVARPPKPSLEREEFLRVLRHAGLHAALGFVNARGEHRFTGVYRFDGDTLRSVSLFDRLNPAYRRGDDLPMAETYCSIIAVERRPFLTTDAEADPRLAHHPNRLRVRSYCGELLRNADATPFGTLCNFDLVSRPAPEAFLALLQLVAPVLSAEVGEPG